MSIEQLQAEKLDLIGWISSIQDIAIIEKIKNIKKNLAIDKYEASLKPMSKQELINRANEANEAIEKYDVISQEDLKKETKNW